MSGGALPPTVIDWLLLVVPWSGAVVVAVWSRRRTRRGTSH